jgi:hypothetical protein
MSITNILFEAINNASFEDISVVSSKKIAKILKNI